MQIRATVIKLLSHYTPEELMRHIAGELQQQAAHYKTVGAPLRAAYIEDEALVLHNAALELRALPYPPILVPKS